MHRLVDLVSQLGAGRAHGVIYAARPWGPHSMAAVHDPWSVVGPPTDLEPLIDVDLAVEYLRTWSSWQPQRPGADAAVAALLRFAARPGSLAGMPSLPTLRASTNLGHEYTNPSEDLIYQILLQVTSGEERFFVLERLSDPSGQTYVQVMREQDCRFVVEQRAGAPAAHRSVTMATMPAVYSALLDWAFHGIDIDRGLHATVDHGQTGGDVERPSRTPQP